MGCSVSRRAITCWPEKTKTDEDEDGKTRTRRGSQFEGEDGRTRRVEERLTSLRELGRFLGLSTCLELQVVEEGLRSIRERVRRKSEKRVISSKVGKKEEGGSDEERTRDSRPT